jgi:hypothetical protein
MYGPYTQEDRDTAAKKHGVPIEDVNELMEALGGEGEFVNPEDAIDLWREFCDDFLASWIIPDKLGLGNFAAWLILRNFKNEKEIREYQEYGKPLC